MITANELRLGNIINCLGKDGIWYKAVVSGLTNNEITVGVGIKLSKVKPIEISEQILLKCGFVYSEPFPNVRGILFKDNFEIGLDGYDFMLNQMSVRFNKSVIINIKYLHQLQNLYFALTGQELDCTQILQIQTITRNFTL